MNFQKMMVLVLAAAVWTGCAKQMREPEVPVLMTEDPVQTEDTEEVTTVQFTATIAPKEAGKTKAVSADGTTTWAVDEQIALYYQTNSSYSTSTATVTSVDGSGVATITATLSDAKDAGTVEFVYPAIQHDGKGGIDEKKFLTQTGAIDGISEFFDLATGTGTLQVDDDGATLSASVTMENQILIGKFIPKNNGEAISGITRLTINDGTRTYTAMATVGTFGIDGIYVAMLPVAATEVSLIAETASQKYGFGGKLITLEQGKLYNNLAIPMLKAYDLSAGNVSTTEDAFIYQSNPAVTTNTVTVGSGCKAIIHSLNYEYNQASGITCLGNATLVLSGKSVISSYSDGTYFNPAIKPGGSDTILMINGSGSLVATGGCLCAAIGGGYNYSCGSIYIDSGTITAIGGIDAPGIGSGRVLINCPSISCGDICISGGSITAIGGERAPGIGAGIGHLLGGSFTSTCGHITITDGITKLIAIRGAQALAPIGTGHTQSFCGTIEIDGTTSWTAGTRTDNYNFFQTTSANTNDTWTITKEDSADNNLTTGTTSGTITIPDGGEYTLLNSTISVSSGPAILCEGDATITLIGSNTVSTSAEYYPAIQVGPSGKTLTIQGSGSLNATGAANGAGIGGPNGDIASSCGNINIIGGTITANGGVGAAGIGSGNYGNRIGTITISGGTVNASGVGTGSGIGSAGPNTRCEGITISGGTVTATSNSCPGIGCGKSMEPNQPSSCGPIVLSGGTIQASGGDYCPGIGSPGYLSNVTGRGCSFESITITSSVTRVTATRGTDATCDPIGHGSNNAVTSGSVTIDGTLTKTDNTWTVVGKTTQYTGSYSSTIVLPDGADITFSFVSANVTSGPAVLCEGDATITLVGGNNFYTSASKSPAIQAGPSGKTLTIKGSGSLTATGGQYAAGIGTGENGSCGNINISGGTVTATGGTNSAGIGSGDGNDGNSTCGAITITGGKVTATGGDEGSGIGSGYKGTCGNITISGGTVEATGRDYAAGIGSGDGGKFSSITITSGITSVTATMGSGAQAPIGKGNEDAGSGTVTIDGMTSWTAGTATANLYFDVSNDNTTWTLSPMPLEMHLSGTHSSTIIIRDGGEVTLDNVTANVISGPAILCKGDATITLVGENTVSTSANNYPGIQAGPDGKTLTIKGSGSLTATGGEYAAGIGSGQGGNCGNINISEGIVTATGGTDAAGIGSGVHGKFSSITIGSGITSVTATMGSGAQAPIGMGKEDKGSGTVTIDGTTTWTAGTGTANLDWTVSTTTNTDDTWTLTWLRDRTISGTVSSTITLHDGANVTLDNVTAHVGGPVILCKGDATITLVGENTVYTSTNDCSGIQAGPSGKTLTIQGSGSLTATGGDNAAGIGSGENGTCGDIIISGGTVTATGDERGAGIGSGSEGTCGDITISGGTVTANGGNEAAGIGTGRQGTCGDIIISGGTVTATGRNEGAGIGSGYKGYFASITIESTSTSVTATMGDDAQAPIGRGSDDTASGTVTIDGLVNPTADALLLVHLNWSVTNSGKTWTLTPKSSN